MHPRQLSPGRAAGSSECALPFATTHGPPASWMDRSTIGFFHRYLTQPTVRSSSLRRPSAPNRQPSPSQDLELRKTRAHECRASRRVRVLILSCSPSHVSCPLRALHRSHCSSASARCERSSGELRERRGSSGESSTASQRGKDGREATEDHTRACRIVPTVLTVALWRALLLCVRSSWTRGPSAVLVHIRRQDSRSSFTHTYYSTPQALIDGLPRFPGR